MESAKITGDIPSSEDCSVPHWRVERTITLCGAQKMAEMWYYTSEGKQMDPVTMNVLKRLVKDGTLKPTDMVWKDGMGRWIRASSLKELYPDPISALDHYFTSTKSAAPPANSAESPTGPTAVVAFGNGVSSNGSPSKPAAPSPSLAEEDLPQRNTKKRRSTSQYDDEDSGAGRSRSSQGGMSLGIIISLLLGLLLIFGSLTIGVIFLVVVNRPNDPAPQAANPVAINDAPDALPIKDNAPEEQPKKENKEIKKTPIPADVKVGAGTISTDISPTKNHEFKLFVKAGGKATVSAKSRSNKVMTDFNLVILKENNNVEIISDMAPDRNARVEFSLPADEIVRVRVINNEQVGPTTKCTISYNGG